MDPITLAALVALITAGVFIIIQLVCITAVWLKKKLQERVQNNNSGVVINGPKLQEMLQEAVGETTSVSLDELDMMLASIDETGEIKDIEFISSEEGMDESTRNFMRNHGDMILLTNNA